METNRPRIAPRDFGRKPVARPATPVRPVQDGLADKAAADLETGLSFFRGDSCWN